MPTDTIHIGARLDADLVREIDRSANEDHRDRTGQLGYLATLGLAGRRRLKELESVVAGGATHDRTSTAAEAHLREHARLTGFDPKGGSDD